MAREPMLERLKRSLYPFMRSSDLQDAFLGAPADELAHYDAVLTIFGHGGSYLEPGVATVTAGTATVTQVAAVHGTTLNWNTRFKVGDEIILGGSLSGQQGVFPITAIAGGGLTMTVTVPGGTFAVTETGLLYAKSTFRLIQLTKELMLFPGGYETDTDLRQNLLYRSMIIHQQRGSSIGVEEEVARISNAVAETLETSPPLRLLASGIAFDATTRRLANTGSWATGMVVGESIAVLGSTKTSNGRYVIYNIDGSGVELARRAMKSQRYPLTTRTNALELHVREDREQRRLIWRVVNTTAGALAVTFNIAVSGATYASATVTTGAGSVVLSGGNTVATCTWTVPAGETWEVTALLTIPSGLPIFTLTRTAGTLNAVLMGGAALFGRTVAGVLNSSAVWKWGGLIPDTLRGNQPGGGSANSTGLSIYAKTVPGWFLGVSGPGLVEEDSYTMASPDEFVVLEVDHRNTRNYSEKTFKTVVTDYLSPANVDTLLGLL